MFSLAVLFIDFCILYSRVLFGEMFPSDGLCTILIAAFSLAYLYDINRSEWFGAYANEISLGYVLRIFLLYFDIYGRSIYRLPNSGADSSKFFRSASSLLGYGDKLDMGAFSHVMAVIFKFIGINQLLGQFIIMLTSLLAILVFSRILEYIAISPSKKKIVMMVVNLLPNYAILSAIFLREAPVTLFITLSLFFFIKWLNGASLGFVFISIIFDLVAAYFHSGSVGVLIGYIAVIFLYDRVKGKMRISVRSIGLAGIMLFIISYLYFNYSDVLFAKFGRVDSIEDVANTLDYGGSTYAQYVGDSSSVQNMLIYTIPRIVYFLFSPFPWQWRGLSDVIAFTFSSLFYIYTVVTVIKNMPFYSRYNRNQAIAILIIAFCIVFIFAWGVANTGTAARHRDKMVMIFGTLLALGFNRGEGTSGGIKSSRGFI